MTDPIKLRASLFRKIRESMAPIESGEDGLGKIDPESAARVISASKDGKCSWLVCGLCGRVIYYPDEDGAIFASHSKRERCFCGSTLKSFLKMGHVEKGVIFAIDEMSGESTSGVFAEEVGESNEGSQEERIKRIIPVPIFAEIAHASPRVQGTPVLCVPVYRS